MFALMLAAAAAAATATPARPLRPIYRYRGQAHAVMDRQLSQPARAGAAGGVSAEEADLIMQHYLISIGKRLEITNDTAAGQPQQ